MHPAPSIIAFTVASGAGYGILAWLGLHALATPPDRAVSLSVLGLALALVTGGLAASTLHLGRPERAWRALSQWRSSWLSREGVAALATYAPTLVFAAALIWPEALGGAVRVAGALMAAAAAVTVWCTAMIYGSLAPIRAWHTRRVLGLYFSHAGLTGILAYAAVAHLLGKPPPFLIAPVALVIGLAWMATKHYWEHVDRQGVGAPSPGQAIGLGEASAAVPLEPPHARPNYIEREMVYHAAAQRIAQMRHVAENAAFVLPLALIIATDVLPPWGDTVAVSVAAISALTGAAVQRWLFFAEARHLVSLYYDRPAAITA